MNTPPTFINFHGFMGDADNKNCRALGTLFKEAQIVSPQIDYLKESPSRILARCGVYFKKYGQDGGPVVFVGQSLGGWVAEQLSRKYGVPCLLTNPCLDPHLCTVIAESPIPRDFLEEYKALSAPAKNSKSFTLCTKSDEVLGRESFDRCALLGGWLKEVGGKHSSIENLEEELKRGADAALKANCT